MSQPRLLDLYCCAGGAGMGYHRAGFEVVGVDIKPQPRYPFEFHQGDAIEFAAEHGREFDAIHASPPCQAHSKLRSLQKGKVYPELIPATRAALRASGKPYVIENVPGAPLGESGFLLVLCGTMFGLATPDGHAEIQRHRLFECSFCFGLRPACQHGAPGREALTVSGHSTHGARYTKRRRAMTVTGNTPQTNTVRNTVRETFTVDDARAAMGIDWMPMKALSQAIPPAYTEWIGKRLLSHLGLPAPAAQEAPQEAQA